MRIRRAQAADLPAIVSLFAIPGDGNVQDQDPGPALDARYEAALDAIARDPNNAVYVADRDDRVVGTFQLTFIQHLAYRGGLVAQIENVIVHPDARSHGIGATMMTWAIDESRRRGCVRIQLTSNKSRERAHRFYERLGFVCTHEGFKQKL